MTVRNVTFTLALVCAASPSAHAGLIGKIQNAVMRASQRAEIGALAMKAKAGLLKEGARVSLKPRIIVDDHGGKSVESKTLVVQGGKLVLQMRVSGRASTSDLGPMRRAILARKNAPAELAQKIEVARLEGMAERGELREGQLVKLKSRDFHTASGGIRHERVLMSVENGKLVREATVSREKEADGTRPTNPFNENARGVRGGWDSKSSVHTFNDGNARRVFAPFGRAVSGALSDPDFKAASAGDKAALARYEARQADRQYNVDHPRAVAHRFVDGNGKAVTLHNSKDFVDAR